MIIGNGLIASLFYGEDGDEVIFFASGVSNSLETRRAEFEREEFLIRQTIYQNPEKIFVYFSTCSIYDSSKTESPYVLHKLKMEQIVAQNCPQYLILRLSNAVGRGGNPNLLMNYLVKSVREGSQINVHTQASRNLIDVEDIRHLTMLFLKEKKLNCILNLAYIHHYSVIEILQIMENELKISPKINLLKEGWGYEVMIPSEVRAYFHKYYLDDKDFYLSRMLKRYF